MTGRRLWKHDLYRTHISYQSRSLHNICNASHCSQQIYSKINPQNSSPRSYPARNSVTASCLTTRIAALIHKKFCFQAAKIRRFQTPTPAHVPGNSIPPPQATNQAPTNLKSTTPSSKTTYRVQNPHPPSRQHPPLVPSSSKPDPITALFPSHLPRSALGPSNSTSVLLGKAGWTFYFLRLFQRQTKVN